MDRENVTIKILQQVSPYKTQKASMIFVTHMVNFLRKITSANGRATGRDLKQLNDV
jgi:ABC-type polar amino acid transport system ATPase subunit